MTPPRKRRIVTDDDESDTAAQDSRADTAPKAQENQSPNNLPPRAAIPADPAEPVANSDHVVHPSIVATHEGTSAQPVVCNSTSSDDDENDIVEPGLSIIIQPSQRALKIEKKKKKQESPKKRQRVVSTRSSLRKPQEAIESSATSDSRSCEESDTNSKAMFPAAAALYRDSILSVRNKASSRNHKSAAEDLCPVCARFADFLKFFLPRN